MRTTIDIPDSVFRQAKATAALEGKTLKAFLLEALKQELSRQKERKRETTRVKLPLVKSKHPGSLRVTSDTVSRALDREEIHALTGH